MTRKEKGIEIATKFNLSQQENKTWMVPSQSGRGKYMVNVDAKPPNCTCPDFEINQAKCKHIFAVEITLQKQQGPNQAVNAKTVKAEKLSQSKKAKPTYSQKWTEYNQAQTNQKPLFQEFLHQLCQSIEVPQGPKPDCTSIGIYTCRVR